MPILFYVFASFIGLGIIGFLWALIFPGRIYEYEEGDPRNQEPDYKSITDQLEETYTSYKNNIVNNN